MEEKIKEAQVIQVAKEVEDRIQVGEDILTTNEAIALLIRDVKKIKEAVC